MLAPARSSPDLIEKRAGQHAEHSIAQAVGKVTKVNT